ncbi:MAG TPA: zf-HC2 domain-containing protein [Vicinamibacteria bacterium]|nr:zf-HC2 domain-containing protein [Vicinamibacteria bacterium]
MTCEELYDRLTELAEGTLQGQVHDEVDRHLAGCRECQHLRADLEDLARLCRQVGAATSMPDEVRRRIEVLLGCGGESPAGAPA